MNLGSKALRTPGITVMAKKELENITMATSKPMQRKIWKLDKNLIVSTAKL